MIRAIINMPSAPPIDIAIMDNRGLDEWPGLLPPICAEEAVGLFCVEEVLASDCAVETVGICVVEIAPSGPLTVPVTPEVREVTGVVETVPPGAPVTVLVLFEVREVIDLDELDWAVSGVKLGGVIGGADPEAVDPSEYSLPGGQTPPQGSTEQQPVNGGLAQL